MNIFQKVNGKFIFNYCKFLRILSDCVRQKLNTPDIPLNFHEIFVFYSVKRATNLVLDALGFV